MPAMSRLIAIALVLLASAAGAQPTRFYGPQEMKTVGSRVFFTVKAQEVWVTDGTPSGTQRLHQMDPSPFYQLVGNWPPSATDRNWPPSPTEQFTSEGGAVYFLANDAQHGREVWRTDGTPAGTAMVADLVPGAAGSVEPEYPSWMILGALGNGVVGISGRGIVVSDGTPAGSSLLTSWTGDVGSMANLAGRAYFPCRSSDMSTELCTSDGTPGGTMFIDITPGLEGTHPNNVHSFAGSLYFTDVYGSDLWRSDGTAEGSIELAEPGVARFLTKTPGALFMAGESYDAMGSLERRGLWRTDGSTVPLLVKEFALVQSIMAAGDRVFFTARDGYSAPIQL
jgi:ELWxxDGT repeat protein